MYLWFGFKLLLLEAVHEVSSGLGLGGPGLSWGLGLRGFRVHAAGYSFKPQPPKISARRKMR